MKRVLAFSIASRRMISGGNLGNQCYRDYFYGKDKVVEKALGGIEDSAAIFISRMILNGGSVPARLSAEHLILAHFLVLQASRTGYEAEAQAEAAEKMFDILYGDQDEKPDENQFGLRDSILLSLRVAARAVPVMYDLKIKLLRNETDVLFITSDNPIKRRPRECSARRACQLGNRCSRLARRQTICDRHGRCPRTWPLWQDPHGAFVRVHRPGRRRWRS